MIKLQNYWMKLPFSVKVVIVGLVVYFLLGTMIARLQQGMPLRAK